jgi:hypothetical protein
MIELASVAAAAAVVGGVVAVTARTGRTIALGLAVAFVAAPLAASPLPGQLSLFARIAGAVLAAELLWVGTRVRAVRGEGSAIGPAAEAAIAAAAFLIGLWIAPVKPLPGPVTQQAAGLALVALAMIPLVGRDVLRLGIGAALLAVGLSLLREAWLGPGPSLEHFAVAALLVAILGATSLLVALVPEYHDATEPGRAGESTAVIGTGAGGASQGKVAEAPTAAPTTGRASSAAAEPAAVDHLDHKRGGADAAIEVQGPRPSPRSGSMVRRTRHPRGSEPRQ